MPLLSFALAFALAFVLAFAFILPLAFVFAWHSGNPHFTMALPSGTEELERIFFVLCYIPIIKFLDGICNYVICFIIPLRGDLNVACFTGGLLLSL